MKKRRWPAGRRGLHLGEDRPGKRAYTGHGRKEAQSMMT